MNALTLSKMETKWLELGATKCFQMHIGKKTQYCPSLLIENSSSMEKTEKQRYLGDIISSDSKIDNNIKMRVEKGQWIVNDIVSIISEMNLGQHYFEVAFMLHSALFVNGILYSTEALMAIKKATLTSS